MTFGTGSQALVNYLASNWQASRTGRGDIPTSTTVHRSTPGTVFITQDRDEVAVEKSVHDLVHCYHPEADGIDVRDAGSQEQGTTEAVRIDVEVSDRTHPDTGERVYANAALVGDRDDANFPSNREPPYPGIAGEVKYLLEDVRKGFEEWDRVSHDVRLVHMGNSNARAHFHVELEIIAENTADAF